MVDLERCLKAFHQDEDVASRLYLDFYRRLLNYFESNRCLDSNHCADIVMERFAQIATTKKVQNSRPLIFSIAWKVLHEYWRNIKREKKLAMRLGAPSPINSTDNDQAEDTDMELVKSECRKRCVSQMASEDRTLIMRYNDSGGGEKLYESRKKLADDLGVTLPELRKRVCNIRRDLRGAYERCVSSTQE